MRKPRESDDNGTLHTLESVENTFRQLEKELLDIKVSISTMKSDPKIFSLRVQYESSRTDGIIRVRSWAGALCRAVEQTRDALLLKEAEAAAEPVSEADTEPNKPSKRSNRKNTIAIKPDTQPESKPRGKTLGEGG